MLCCCFTHSGSGSDDIWSPRQGSLGGGGRKRPKHTQNVLVRVCLTGSTTTSIHSLSDVVVGDSGDSLLAVTDCPPSWTDPLLFDELSTKDHRKFGEAISYDTICNTLIKPCKTAQQGYAKQPATSLQVAVLLGFQVEALKHSRIATQLCTYTESDIDNVHNNK